MYLRRSDRWNDRSTIRSAIVEHGHPGDHYCREYRAIDFDDHATDELVRITRKSSSNDICDDGQFNRGQSLDTFNDQWGRIDRLVAARHVGRVRLPYRAWLRYVSIRELHRTGDDHMRSKLIVLTAIMMAPCTANGHAVFPGQQSVYTAGDRGIAYFQASNDRKDVLDYKVEIFDYESWSPTRLAVASPERIIVPVSSSAPGGASIRRFTVLVDLDGKSERVVRVCTKSIMSNHILQLATSSVNTRVCAKLTVRRLQ